MLTAVERLGDRWRCSSAGGHAIAVWEKRFLPADHRHEGLVRDAISPRRRNPVPNDSAGRVGVRGQSDSDSIQRRFPEGGAVHSKPELSETRWSGRRLRCVLRDAAKRAEVHKRSEQGGESVLPVPHPEDAGGGEHEALRDQHGFGVTGVVSE